MSVVAAVILKTAPGDAGRRVHVYHAAFRFMEAITLIESTLPLKGAELDLLM